MCGGVQSLGPTPRTIMEGSDTHWAHLFEMSAGDPPLADHPMMVSYDAFACCLKCPRDDAPDLEGYLNRSLDFAYFVFDVRLSGVGARPPLP